jgi:drug/metabolite transporter (DMT)-like permease
MESRGLSSASLVGQGEAAAAKLETPGEPKLWKIVIAFTIYGSLNLFLNFFNKWAMAPSGAGFSLPVFYSTWHMLMSIIGSLVLMLVKKPESGMVSFAQLKMYKWETLTLAVCTTVNISCNNASLMLIGLFVNQVIKALSPMIVMGMSYFVLKRRYGPKLIASVIFIAVGAVMAVPFKDPSVTVLGIVLVGTATLASSLKPVVGELLMTSSDKPKLAPAALVFYDSCFSFVFMVTFWLSVPAEREGSITYMREKPAMGWGIILIGSFAAFAYNMSIYNFTKLASAVAVMVTTNLLKVLLITAAAVVEGIRDPINWIGISIFFASVIAYAYLSYQAKQTAKKTATAATAPEAKPTETSNLVTK